MKIKEIEDILFKHHSYAEIEYGLYPSKVVYVEKSVLKIVKTILEEILKNVCINPEKKIEDEITEIIANLEKVHK